MRNAWEEILAGTALRPRINEGFGISHDIGAQPSARSRQRLCGLDVWSTEHD
jgi:hypothetical protein